MKPVAVKLDDELQARLKALGERCGRSPHWLMKKAISEYVDRMEAEENERQLIMSRWDNYQETGETDKESECPININISI